MRSAVPRYALAAAVAVASVALFVLLVTLPSVRVPADATRFGQGEVGGVAFLIAVLVPLIARGFRGAVGPAAGTIAAVVVLPWIAILFLSACLVLDAPLVSEQARGAARFDPSEWGSLWVVTTVVLGAGSGWVARRRLGTPLRVAAALATALACVTAVVGLARARRPDPAGYVERLAKTQPRLGLGPVHLGAGRFEYLMGDLGKTCVLRVRTPSYHTEEVVDGPPRCRGIAVAEDPVSDTYVVLRFQLDDAPAPVFALRRDTLEPVAVTLDDIAKATAPPHRWTAFGAAGAGLALFWLVMGWRVRPHRLDGALDAQHSGDGWVHVDGAPPRHLASLGGQPPGPVALLVDERARASYRDDGVVGYEASAEPGTRDELIARDHARQGSFFAQAFVTAALTLAPLAAAAAFGLR